MSAPAPASEDCDFFMEVVTKPKKKNAGLKPVDTLLLFPSDPNWILAHPTRIARPILLDARAHDEKTLDAHATKAGFSRYFHAYQVDDKLIHTTNEDGTHSSTPSTLDYRNALIESGRLSQAVVDFMRAQRIVVGRGAVVKQ